MFTSNNPQDYATRVFRAEHVNESISIVDCFTGQEVLQTYTGQPGTASLLFIKDGDTVKAFHGWSKELLWTCNAAAIEAMLVEVENGGTWDSMCRVMQRA